MALTDTQKASVRYYLGYSDGSRQVGGSYALEGALLALSSAAETRVIADLAALATIDADIITVNGSARAGLKSVDNGGVVWADDGMSAVRAINSSGRMFVHRIARTLGVSVCADVFGADIATGGPCGRG